MLFGSLVDVSALWKIAAAAVVGGIGLAGVFAFTVVTASRYELDRTERRAGVGNGALAAIGLAICVAGIAVGIYAMTQK